VIQVSKKFRPPKSAINNAKKGLEFRKKYGRGGLTPAEAKSYGIDSGITRAKRIASGKLSEHDVRRMSAFNRHRGNYNPSKKMADGGPTAGTIAWLLWGGTSGVNWAKKQSAALGAEESFTDDEKDRVRERLIRLSKPASDSFIEGYLTAKKDLEQRKNSSKKQAESFEADVESVVSELRELGMPQIIFEDDEERIKINGELVYKMESAPRIRDGIYSQPLFYIGSKHKENYEEYAKYMNHPLQDFDPAIWVRTPKGLIKNTLFHRNKILENKIQRRLQENYEEYAKKNPFECLCGKRFKNDNALKKHQKDKKHPNYHPSHTLFDNELKGPPINIIRNPDGITLKEVYLMFPNWDGNYVTWEGKSKKPLKRGFNYFNAESFEADDDVFTHSVVLGFKFRYYTKQNPIYKKKQDGSFNLDPIHIVKLKILILREMDLEGVEYDDATITADSLLFKFNFTNEIEAQKFSSYVREYLSQNEKVEQLQQYFIKADARVMTKYEAGIIFSTLMDWSNREYLIDFLEYLIKLEEYNYEYSLQFLRERGVDIEEQDDAGVSLKDLMLAEKGGYQSMLEELINDIKNKGRRLDDVAFTLSADNGLKNQTMASMFAIQQAVEEGIVNRTMSLQYLRYEGKLEAINQFLFYVYGDEGSFIFDNI